MKTLSPQWHLIHTLFQVITLYRLKHRGCVILADKRDNRCGICKAADHLNEEWKKIK